MNAVAVEKLVGDVEALPFPEHSFDLVISNLSLHWVSVKSVRCQLANRLCRQMICWGPCCMSNGY